MTPYYLTFASVLFLLMLAQSTQPAAHFRGDVVSARRVSGFFLFCAASVLVLVAGLRYQVGTDYTGYVRNYDTYKTTFVDDLWSFNEPGIKAIATAMSWVWDNPTGYILASSVITLGLLLRTYAKYSPSVAFSFIIFALAGPWVGSFNGVRQYLAAAVLVAGHRFILDRKPLKFALVVLVAGMFHQSALVAILLLAVPRRRLGPLGLVFVVTLSLVLLNSSEAVLSLLEQVKGEELTTPYVTSSINPLRIAVAVAPLALYALTPAGDPDPDEWFYRNFAVVHAVVLVAASWSAYVGRFGIYTAAFIPLFLPRLVRFQDAGVTLVARIGLVMLYGIYWYLDVSPSESLNNFRFVFDP